MDSIDISRLEDIVGGNLLPSWWPAASCEERRNAIEWGTMLASTPAVGAPVAEMLHNGYTDLRGKALTRGLLIVAGAPIVVGTAYSWLSGCKKK